VRCKCGGETSVKDTRRPDASPQVYVGPLRREADETVAWWTPDFVARRRVCLACREHMITVEVATADLRGMLQSAHEWPR
jgi:hypothetical protein